MCLMQVRCMGAVLVLLLLGDLVIYKRIVMEKGMEIHSSIGKLSTFKAPSSGYEQLDREYTESGFTYKSNEILHKTAENNVRQYPYELLLYVTKVFHLNQFEIIFFSHVLNDVEPCYNTEPELFNEDIEIHEQVQNILEEVLRQQRSRYTYSSQMEQLNIILKSTEVKKEEEPPKTSFSLQELKRIYSYLLVLGYAVKYYLNEQIVIKPYDEEIKLRHPTFFASIFNKWAKKYGNSALATTPRRINSYYQTLANQLENDNEKPANPQDDNCQYRNYNEIVEELIKATTDPDQPQEMEVSNNPE